ncbi:MAG: Nif11-like leader peptide family RiPP precursor [Proteobacteria bacterium]|nr:Nif11-like leader peptide family RiPP precursor [Pseudomonadota bacterium]
MSLDHAKKMLEKLKTDKKLVEKIKAADDAGKKKIAAGLGLSFTGDEMKKAIKSNSELSDENLATVAGGSSAPWVSVGAGSAAGAAGAAAACGW